MADELVNRLMQLYGDANSGGVAREGLSNQHPDLINALTANFKRNQIYARPGPYQTFLPPKQEGSFRAWVTDNAVPFNPLGALQDYDMRGFWNGLQSGDPRASSAVNPNDKLIHYPDTWKTPYHQSFSAESQWAHPVAPKWIDDHRLAAPSGRVIFDEKAASDGR